MPAGAAGGEGARSAEEETAWKQSSARFTAKRNSEYFDPCQEAADRSLRCIRRNGGDKSMCADYFDAYKECKKSWIEERAEQKRKQGGSFFG